ncbi:hypothetical protein DW886_17040 [Enterocloster aldenensis]|uniref:hypothetical protein n=1 Tax=Enterocloster aldenensis TaxID=358742 RepID=UPI000E498897|nr:hypothetical protein DW886_17040 [Enterocloster aldenensis]
MADIAKDMQAMSRSYEVISKSIGISIDAAARLLDSLLRNRGTKDLAELIVNHSKDPNSSKDDKLVTRSISPELVGVTKDVLAREKKLAATIIDIDNDDKNSVPSILYFSNHRKEVEQVISEALARAGLLPEIERTISDEFVGKLKDNPMREVKGLTEVQYEQMLSDISKLEYPLNKITLFPKYYENNGETRVDVGFLESTLERTITKNGDKAFKSGPYSIPNIVKGLLAKQLYLGNTKNSKEVENYYAQRVDYRKKLNENVLDIDKMKRDRRNISYTYTVLNKLDLDKDVRERLIDLVKNSTISKQARENLIDEIQKLDIDELTKEQMTKKISELNDIKYVVPAVIVQDGKDFAYELERDTYMKIGAGVTIDKDNKHLLVDTKCADKEFDIFSLSNMTTDNRTLLVLNQEEFDNFRKEDRGKKYKNYELEYTHNGEEPLAQSYTELSSELDKLDSSFIQVISDNRESLVSNIEGMDAFDLIAEEYSPKAIEDLLLDNIDDKDQVAEVMDIIGQDYLFEEVKDPYCIARELEEAYEECEQEREMDRNIDDSFEHNNGFEEPDDYFDRNHNNRDDRDE